MSLKKKILELFGTNEVQLKWKIERLRKRFGGDDGDGGPNDDDQGSDDEGDKRPAHRRTKHCPSCRALVSHDQKVCHNCDSPLPSMATVRVTRFLRGLVPDENPTTKLVLAFLFGFFVVMTLDAMTALEGDLFGALMTPPGQVMWRWGAHLRGDLTLWRLIMSNFLHFGIIHLLFNAYALRIAGPEVERLYGSAMAAVLFVVTGVGAMVVSNLLGGTGLVAGASGALMGFFGLAAAGGHRDGSSYGIAVRDRMLRWTAFVMFIGFAASMTGFMAIDNIAHAAGFAVGGGLGLFVPLRTMGRRPSIWEWRGIAVGLLLSLATVGYGIYGMLSTRLGMKTFERCVQALGDEKWPEAVEACEEARDAQSDFIGAWHNLAIAYVRADRPQDALATCAEAADRFGRDDLFRSSELCARILE